MNTGFDRRFPTLRRAALSLAGGLCAAAAAAQLASDEVPRQRTIPDQSQVETDMQNSRFRLGPMRLIPTISVTNAGYDNNVFGTNEDPIGDYTFTVRGGVRFVVPFGTKVYLRGDALPQYTWYDKLTERRGVGGFYDASLLGFFNRMAVQATVYDTEDFVIYSSEVLTRVKTRTLDGSGGLEVDLAKRFSIFGRGEVARSRYSTAGQLPGLPVDENDRTDSMARGGVRYRLSPQWNVTAGFEQTWSDFVRDFDFRNNQSRAYLVGLHYDRPQFYINLSGGYREGRPRSGSTFPEYSTGTGSFFASYFPMRWLELQGYGRRRTAYSLTTTNPYYFENRIGGGVNVEVLSRILVRGFAEAGPNNYPLPVFVDGEPVKRRDQSKIYGGGLSILIARPAVVTGIITRNQYDSNIPGESRSITRFTVTMSFAGELSR